MDGKSEALFTALVDDSSSFLIIYCRNLYAYLHAGHKHMAALTVIELALVVNFPISLYQTSGRDMNWLYLFSNFCYLIF